jgi:hypothetical protein
VLTAWAQVVVALATVVTLIFLIVYTVETRRLRLAAQSQVAEAQRQTQLSRMPLVVVDYGFHAKGEGGEFRMPVIRNVGPGPAFNVNIEGLGGIEFRHPRTLASGETQSVTMLLDAGKHTRKLFELEKEIKDGLFVLPAKASVSFEGVDGTAYVTHHTLDIQPGTDKLLIEFDGTVLGNTGGSPVR